MQITKREKDVLMLLIQGKTNKEIGCELFISHHTVKVILEKIYEKLNCSSRVEAAVIAIKNKLV